MKKAKYGALEGVATAEQGLLASTALQPTLPYQFSVEGDRPLSDARNEIVNNISSNPSEAVLLETPAFTGANGINGFCFIKELDLWFSTWTRPNVTPANSDRLNIAVHSRNGRIISYSGTLGPGSSQTVFDLGHGQTLDYKVINGVYTLFCTTSDGRGVSLCDLPADFSTNGWLPLNYRAYTLQPAGVTAGTVALSLDKEMVIKTGGPYNGGKNVRTCRLSDLLALAPGDYSDRVGTLLDETMQPENPYANQGIGSDGKYLMLYNGNNLPNAPKTLTYIRMQDKKVLGPYEVPAGKKLAIAQNGGAGTTMEPEGMTWVEDAYGVPRPWVCVATQTADGTANAMWLLPLFVNKKPAVLPFFRNLYRKRVLKEFPTTPPNYATVVAALSTSYIYPQSFHIDFVANQIVILFSPAGGTGINWVAVFNWATGAYVRGFYAGQGYSGIHITYEGGSRFLWVRGSGALLKYNITTLPAELSSPSPTTSTTMDIYLDMAGRGTDLLIAEGDTPLGTKRRVDRFYLTSTTALTRKQTIKFRIPDVGDNNEYQAYFPHKQSTALGDGFIAMSFGGNYTTGSPTASQYQGIRIFAMDATRLVDALYRPDVARTIFTNAGYVNTRLENEGCFVGPDNTIYSLAILLGAGDSSTRGIAILEEFAQGPDTLDFSKAAVTAPSPLLGSFANDVVLLKSSGNATFNPVTGEQFTTLAQVLDFMKALDVTKVTFTVNSAGITDIDGGAFPSGHMVEIFNINNGTFYIDIRGNSIDGRLQVAGTPYVQTYLWQTRRGAGAPSVSAAIIGAQYVDTTGGDLYIATATGSSNWKKVTRAT